MLQSCGLEIWAGSDGFFAPGFMMLNLVLTDCVLFWRLWGWIPSQVHSGCWWNSVPCGCRTEVPISLLAVGQRSISDYRGCPHSLAHGLHPSSKAPMAGWVLFTQHHSNLASMVTSLSLFHLLRTLVITRGSALILLTVGPQSGLVKKEGQEDSGTSSLQCPRAQSNSKSCTPSSSPVI